MKIRIALVGDYNPDVTAHIAIPKALAINAAESSCIVENEWLATRDIKGDIDNVLSGFDGIWCVPASPYENTDGVLAAIQWARESDKPFLGTCGGYQHAMLEYARSVLGYTQADNAEINPHCHMPLIAALSCSLIEESGDIIFIPESKIANVCGTTTVNEKYHCSFGLNPEYGSLFDNSDLNISAHDPAGEPRAIELIGHRFFIGTAYQPERSALEDKTHPLISAFVSSVRK